MAAGPKTFAKRAQEKYSITSGANPGLAPPSGWHGDPGHFYAVLQRWLELLCDEDTYPLVN